MVKFDYLNFLFGFVEDIQKRSSIIANFINSIIRNLNIFLFVKILHSLTRFQIEQSVPIPPSFFISDSISDKRLFAQRLMKKNKKVEVIGVIFVRHNHQQILFNLGILDLSFNMKLSSHFCFIKINHFHLFLPFGLKSIPSLVNCQNIFQKVDC